ncbi:hypothetical protein GCM10009677_42300 [Sphaerisporangium rubeum]
MPPHYDDRCVSTASLNSIPNGRSRSPSRWAGHSPANYMTCLMHSRPLKRPGAHRGIPIDEPYLDRSHARSGRQQVPELGTNTGCCTINPIIRDTFRRHFVVDFALLG